MFTCRPQASFSPRLMPAVNWSWALQTEVNLLCAYKHECRFKTLGCAKVHDARSSEWVCLCDWLGYCYAHWLTRFSIRFLKSVFGVANEGKAARYYCGVEQPWDGCGTPFSMLSGARYHYISEPRHWADANPTTKEERWQDQRKIKYTILRTVPWVFFSHCFLAPKRWSNRLRSLCLSA